MQPVKSQESMLFKLCHQFVSTQCMGPKFLQEMVFYYQNCFEPTVRKNCFSDREKLLKFEDEGQEFARFLKSLEQFIQAVKGQKIFW